MQQLRSDRSDMPMRQSVLFAGCYCVLPPLDRVRTSCLLLYGCTVQRQTLQLAWLCFPDCAIATVNFATCSLGLPTLRLLVELLGPWHFGVHEGFCSAFGEVNSQANTLSNQVQSPRSSTTCYHVVSRIEICLLPELRAHWQELI